MNCKNASLTARNAKGEELEHELFETVKEAKLALQYWLETETWIRRSESKHYHKEITSINLYIEDEFEEQFIPKWHTEHQPEPVN